MIKTIETLETIMESIGHAKTQKALQEATENLRTLLHQIESDYKGLTENTMMETSYKLGYGQAMRKIKGRK